MIERMKKIRVNLDRGLGNQLFTFHAGLFLASQTDSQLLIDLTGTRNEEQNRNSSINAFKVSVRNAVFPISWLSTSKAPSRIFIERAIHKLFKSSPIGRALMRQYRSLTYGYDEKLLHIRIPTQIWGNYQSYRYPLGLYQLGIDVALDLKDPSPWYLAMKEKAEKSHPISIHVRRGDYANYASDLGLLSEEYFIGALEHYLLRVPRSDRPIWIFSDTLEAAFALRISLGRDDVHVIQPPTESSSAENLLLLSLSSAIISSNSSFSWWAAWLGREHNYVIVPQPYYKSFAGEFLDHIPPTWQSFPSSFL